MPDGGARIDARLARVAVIYTHFPHYRAPVFDEMARAPGFDYSFHHDPDGIAATILNGSARRGHHRLKVVRLGPLLLQPGAIGLALRGKFHAFVFLGNPFILTTWPAALIARLRGRPVLFWTHGWLRRETGAKGRLRRAFYRLADDLLVYGARARDVGAAAGYPEARIHVIYNSLDYDTQKALRQAITPAPPARPSRPGAARFLTIGRLVDALDIGLALEAMALLKADPALDIRLTIVGDGPLRATLERRAAEQGLPVRFTGAIHDEVRLARLFRDATAVVSPGKVGLLAMHALAYGVPVITHGDPDRQMPEHEAIEDGLTGAFFAHGDAAGLAEAMRRFALRGAPEGAAAAAISRIEADYTPARQAHRIGAAITIALDRRQR